MKRMPILLALVVLLVFAGTALAMSSAHYQMNWSTSLTGSGGGTHSAHYAGQFTVGQTDIGSTSSNHYKVCLGYWCGTTMERRLYLPEILRYH